MAQTKPKPKKRSAPKSAKSSSKPKSSKRQAPKAKATSPKPQSSRNGAGSSNGSSPMKSVGKVAGKAKVPLVAGGAALAGAAGGLALAASKQSKKSRLTRAAKEVGNFGAQVGELAAEIQRARESADGKHHRSPVEVVLQGLTARR